MHHPVSLVNAESPTDVAVSSANEHFDCYLAARSRVGGGEYCRGVDFDVAMPR